MAQVETGGNGNIELPEPIAGVNYARIINSIATRLQVQHLLSYGYGTKWLMKYLKVSHAMKVQTFLPEKDTPPVPAQFVACVDVLGFDDEAVVLPELERLTDAVLFANIRFSDDKQIDYWLPKLWDRFTLHNWQQTEKDEGFVICYAKPKTVEAPKLITEV